jgi:hypothetical protein
MWFGSPNTCQCLHFESKMVQYCFFMFLQSDKTIIFDSIGAKISFYYLKIYITLEKTSVFFITATFTFQLDHPNRLDNTYIQA